VNFQRLLSCLWLPFRGYRRVAHSFAHFMEKSASFKTPLGVQLPSSFRSLLKRNLDTVDVHKDCRCFIFGNGPSLGKLDLTLFQDDITIGVNGFYKHTQARTCQPSYYCLSPDFFFDGSAVARSFLSELLATIEKSCFYIPLIGQAKNIVRDGCLPLERTFFIPHNGSLVHDDIEKVDFLHSVPNGVNIIQEALLMAFHVGCNPIYLLGVEHDWLATRTGNTHFYSDFARHPTFRYLDQWSYYERIRGALQTWECYLTINRYALKHGIRIVNLTPNSFLDVFESGDLSAFMKKVV